MPKILLLFCGGTIIMHKGTEGSLVVKHRQEAIDSLLSFEPRLQELASIEVEYIDNIDSTNITPHHWENLTRVIADKYDQYDGFVITHGTDTMAYTASALTFSLQNLGKPVILTGSQVPGGEIFSDARTNLVNSVRVALMNISGVYIVFDKKIILGARSSKISESKLSAFSTKNAPDVGEIRTEVRLNNSLPKRTQQKITPSPQFENDVLVITLIPGRNISHLINIIEHRNTKGLIIRAYASGNIPSEFLPVLEKAREKKIPVVVTSQCLHGSTAMDRYDVGAQALKLNVIQLYDISLECAVTKFMWALKNYAYDQIKSVMQRNFVGEMNLDGSLYK